ncbi:MAG: glycosyltransferase family 39 protein [Chloroflexi bacterium]|nr:glycosyltransferase family 39 protein [Chloroflexota bacterium]
MAVLVIAVGLALLLLSFFLPPYEAVKAYIDSMSLRGFVDFFTPGFYARIQQNVRLFALLVLGAGIAMLAFRRRLSQYIAIRLAALPDEVRDLLDFVRPHETTRSLALAAGLLCGLGALLRLAFLSQPIMSWDEAATFLTYASRPLYVVLSNYSAPNNHVLHTVLVYVSYHLFGDALWAIRLPACIAGVLIMPVAYLVAYRIYERWSALLTVALASVAPVLVDYSTDARGYTLAGLLFLLMLLCATYLIKRPTNGFVWMLFVILCALGLYTIPIMLYGIGMVSAWMLLSYWLGPDGRAERWRFTRQLAAADVGVMALAALFYAPVLIVSGLGSIIANGYVAPLALPELVMQLPRSLQEAFALWTDGQPVILTLALLVGVAIGTGSPGVRSYRPPLLVVTIVAGLAMVILQRVAPFARTWLFLLPIYYMTAAQGLVRIAQKISNLAPQLPKPHWRLAALLACIGLSLILAVNAYRVKSETIAHAFNAEKVAVYLQGALKPGDSVFFSPNQPLRYWFRRYGISDDYVMLAQTPVSRYISRAWIVVDDTLGPSLAFTDTVAIPYSKDYLYSPVLVRTFEPGLLYQAQIHYGPSAQ